MLRSARIVVETSTCRPLPGRGVPVTRSGERIEWCAVNLAGCASASPPPWSGSRSRRAASGVRVHGRGARQRARLRGRRCGHGDRPRAAHRPEPDRRCPRSRRARRPDDPRPVGRMDRLRARRGRILPPPGPRQPRGPRDGGREARGVPGRMARLPVASPCSSARSSGWCPRCWCSHGAGRRDARRRSRTCPRSRPGRSSACSSGTRCSTPGSADGQPSAIDCEPARARAHRRSSPGSGEAATRRHRYGPSSSSTTLARPRGGAGAGRSRW